MNDKRAGQAVWLAIFVFLFFIPLQKYLGDRFSLPFFFFWVDEVLAAFLLLVFAIFFRRGRESLRSLYLFGCLLILFFLGGLISGLHNNNRIIVSLAGTFDYLKNFLPIIVLPLFRFPAEKVRKLFNYLAGLAVFFCLHAILQEYLYFFGFPSSGEVRLGWLRTSSFLGHPNMLGLYSLLFFILDFSQKRKMGSRDVVLTYGVFLSVSRMVWLSFFLVSLIFFFLRKSFSSAFYLALGTLLLVILVIPPPSFRGCEMTMASRAARQLKSEDKYRGYALRKSIEIWKENFWLGVGPGAYGGVVSVVFPSPVYDRYDFSRKWYDYGLKRFRSLDQFWGQLLAETGLIGAVFFVLILLTLTGISFRGAASSPGSWERNFFRGLGFFPLVMAVYLTGSGLNLTPVLFTYSVFLGLAVGLNGNRGKANESSPDQ